MNLDLIKWIGTIIIGTGLAYAYYIRSNNTVIESSYTNTYTNKYNINDDPEEYEENQKEDHSIHETTPIGDVILLYNDNSQQFTYYSNNDIPYRYLEVVARKYVLTYRCIELYIDTKEEYIKLIKEHVEQQQKEEEEEENNETQEIEDVFVQYKSYNQQKHKVKSKHLPIKQEILLFKRMGTIYDYNQLKEPKKQIKDIGFGEYKNKVS